MVQAQIWRRLYYFLSAVFVSTAALNMLHVRAGFLTNHAADFVVPAWLYVAVRGRAPGGNRGWVSRTVGRSPAVAGLTLFVASTITELSQLLWPHGLFRGTFDPLDIVAFAAGLSGCYALERILMRRLPTAVDAHSGAPAA